MMTWNDVKELLLSRVVPLMKSTGQGEEWLSALERCADGELLGICMAIDVLSGAVLPRVFARVIDKLDAGASDVREEFGKMVSSGPICEDVMCSSNFSASLMDGDDVYVRVLELGSFIRFCVDRGYTRAPSHVKRIRTMYFSTKDGVQLGGMRRWFRGRLPNVWVMSFRDLNVLISGIPDDDKGTLVYNALGLTLKNGVADGNRPELVAVKYPAEFSVGCVQPTTLDAWWVDPGGYYLSYPNEDSWGRTHSLTGDLAPLRERVHSHFKNLTPGYRTYYIGVANSITERREELISDAYERLERVMRGATA